LDENSLIFFKVIQLPREEEEDGDDDKKLNGMLMGGGEREL
jgi:hypothetical protein